MNKALTMILAAAVGISALLGISFGEPRLYQNSRYGFSFNYDGYSMDRSLELVKTSFKNKNTKIDVNYDDFRGSKVSTVMLSYGNKSIKNGRYVKNVESREYIHRGYKTNIITWELKPLERIDYYKYFASAEIFKNSKEAYTIFVRSVEPIDYEKLLKRFDIITQDEKEELIRPRILNYTKKYNRELKAFYKKNFNKGKMQWGIFEPTTINGLEKLEALEEEIDYDFKVLLQYYDLVQPVNIENLYEIYDKGRFLEFTCQTTVYGVQNSDYLYEVLDGKHDATLKGMVSQLVTLDKPILFRLNNEMNGDWCDYSAIHYQKDTDIYIEAWKYIHSLFEEAGADKVLWVWNPNWGDFPSFKWNHYLNYYPGADYVDIIGMTGYNTGSYYKFEKWSSFKDIYEPMASEYNQTFKGFPMIITEFGSAVKGGDKIKWFREMLSEIDKYKVDFAVYWNSIDYDMERKVPSRIYRFSDDKELKQLMKENLKKYKD